MLVFYELFWRYFILYDMYIVIVLGFFFINIEIRIYCIKYEVYYKCFLLFVMVNDFYFICLCLLDKVW